MDFNPQMIKSYESGLEGAVTLFRLRLVYANAIGLTITPSPYYLP